MKSATVLAAALCGVAFAAPATDLTVPFKDLTSLKYSNDLPVAEFTAKTERLEASKPVKDNRNLHYNADNKTPIAMARPERRAATVERREASRLVKDNRNLRYNTKNEMPVAFASPERREATTQQHEASKPVKDNRNLHYNANNKMPIPASD